MALIVEMYMVERMINSLVHSTMYFPAIFTTFLPLESRYSLSLPLHLCVPIVQNTKRPLTFIQISYSIRKNNDKIEDITKRISFREMDMYNTQYGEDINSNYGIEIEEEARLIDVPNRIHWYDKAFKTIYRDLYYYRKRKNRNSIKIEKVNFNI